MNESLSKYMADVEQIARQELISAQITREQDASGGLYKCCSEEIAASMRFEEELRSHVKQYEALAETIAKQRDALYAPIAELEAQLKESMRGRDAFSKEAETVNKEVENIRKWHDSIFESSEGWAQGLEVLHAELPRRGWYLTGKEPCTFTQRLARYAKAKNWDALDSALIAHSAELKLNIDKFIEWLVQKNVPDYCIGRVKCFLEARDAQDHEAAVAIGVPLIDAICRSLFDGKDFTTKRGRQPKPQFACSSDGNPTLGDYHFGFVKTFGLIHEDVDPKRLSDEDYFNRHAILHGQMKRSYGPKDSAKMFMAIMFLVLAFDSFEESQATDTSVKENECSATP